MTSVRHYLLFIVYILSYAISWAGPQVIGNGQVIVLDGSRYYVEGMIDQNTYRELVSLIPLAPGELVPPISELKSGSRIVGNFQKDFFSFDQVGHPVSAASEAFVQPQILSDIPLSTSIGLQDSRLMVFNVPGNTANLTLQNGFKVDTGNYFLPEKKLGSGGMNDVYLAEAYFPGQNPIKRTVAAKFSKAALPDPSAPGGARAMSEASLQRMVNGHKAAGDIPPQYATQVFDAGMVTDADGVVHAVSFMELETGIDLSKYLKRNFPNGLYNDLVSLDPVTKAKAWDFLNSMSQQMQDITKALKDAGIVHGDIKPANLIVETGLDGMPILKLTDMDTVGLVGTIQGPHTMNYLPIHCFEELQATGNFARSFEQDEFAFKATLYRMVFGQNIYAGMAKTPDKVKVVLYGAPQEVLERKWNATATQIADEWSSLFSQTPENFPLGTSPLASLADAPPAFGMQPSTLVQPVVEIQTVPEKKPGAFTTISNMLCKLRSQIGM